MSFKKQIKELLAHTNEIEVIEIGEDSVGVRLPYETELTNIEVEGDSIEEKLESFKGNLNHRLQDMINHLEDCKID